MQPLIANQNSTPIQKREVEIEQMWFRFRNAYAGTTRCEVSVYWHNRYVGNINSPYYQKIYDKSFDYSAQDHNKQVRDISQQHRFQIFSFFFSLFKFSCAFVRTKPLPISLNCIFPIGHSFRATTGNRKLWLALSKADQF